MPFMASLSDIFGRPLCLTLSILVFGAGTVVCAAAPNIGAMLAGRAIQGIGGGGIISLSLVIFTDVVPLKFRPRYVGIMYVAQRIPQFCLCSVGGLPPTHPHTDAF